MAPSFDDPKFAFRHAPRFPQDLFRLPACGNSNLVPFWTMAVANVYRKAKRIAVTTEESRRQHPALKDRQHS
jgi:hypothetical protein